MENHWKIRSFFRLKCPTVVAVTEAGVEEAVDAVETAAVIAEEGVMIAVVHHATIEELHPVTIEVLEEEETGPEARRDVADRLLGKQNNPGVNFLKIALNWTRRPNFYCFFW